MFYKSIHVTTVITVVPTLTHTEQPDEEDWYASDTEVTEWEDDEGTNTLKINDDDGPEQDWVDDICDENPELHEDITTLADVVNNSAVLWWENGNQQEKYPLPLL